MLKTLDRGVMKHIFIAFGLLWIGIWLIFGMFLFIWHGPYLEESRHLIAEGNLPRLVDKMAAWENSVAAFFHALGLALVTITLGAFSSDFDFSPRAKKALIPMQLAGVAISGLCHLADFIPGMVAGECLVFSVIIVCFVKWMKIITK